MKDTNKAEKAIIEKEMEKEYLKKIEDEDLTSVSGGFSMNYFETIVKSKNDKKQ